MIHLPILLLLIGVGITAGLIGWALARSRHRARLLSYIPTTLTVRQLSDACLQLRISEQQLYQFIDESGGEIHLLQHQILWLRDDAPLRQTVGWRWIDPEDPRYQIHARAFRIEPDEFMLTSHREYIPEPPFTAQHLAGIDYDPIAGCKFLRQKLAEHGLLR